MKPLHIVLLCMLSLSAYADGTKTQRELKPKARGDVHTTYSDGGVKDIQIEGDTPPQASPPSTSSDGGVKDIKVKDSNPQTPSSDTTTSKDGGVKDIKVKDAAPEAPSSDTTTSNDGGKDIEVKDGTTSTTNTVPHGTAASTTTPADSESSRKPMLFGYRCKACQRKVNITAIMGRCRICHDYTGASIRLCAKHSRAQKRCDTCQKRLNARQRRGQ